VAWNDGLPPRPPVAEGARPVSFPWDAAGALGAALDASRTAVAENVAARSEGIRLFLGDWVGGHRDEYEAERGEDEGVLAADPLGAALSTLRTAWDDAAELQASENAGVAPAEPTPGGC
jgi:hypothetical protein